MHKDSSVVSWITDYKDRTHFVCVESSVLDKQQSTVVKGPPQETIVLPTTPLCLACTLPGYLKLWFS